MNEGVPMRPGSRLLVPLVLVLLPQAGMAGVPESVVRQALERHPSLQSALATLRAARAGTEAEEWLFYPTLTADLHGSRTTVPSLSLAPGGTALTTGWDTALSLGISQVFPVGTRLSLELDGTLQQREMTASSAGTAGGSLGPGFAFGTRLTLTQPLLRGLGRRYGEAGLRQARLAEESARARAETVVSQVLRDVLTAWWGWQGALAAAEVARQSLDLAIRQREDARTRVRRGVLSPVDALAFETAAASREEEMVQAEALAAQRLWTLRQRMGLPPEDGTGTPPQASPEAFLEDTADLPSEETNPEEMVREALDRAPDLLAADVSLRTLRDRADLAGESSRPRLDLQVWAEGQGLGNRSAGDAFRQFGRAEAGGVFAGFTFEAPLLARRHRAEQAQAREQVRAAEQDLQALRLDVASSAATLVHQVQAAVRRLELARQTAALAESQAQAERRRFEVGTSIAVQVLQAEDALRQARLRVLQARFDLESSLLALRHLSGRLVPWARTEFPGLSL